MYDGCTTSVRTLIGSTESFEVKVGLHQGSALSNGVARIFVWGGATRPMPPGPFHVLRKPARFSGGGVVAEIVHLSP